MEGPVDMKHIKDISTEVKEGILLEDRIKEVEGRLDILNEKLDILSEKINDLLDRGATSPESSEKPESPPTDPIEYDYDDWYSNHGQGD
jgi:hypothetical protein